MSSNKVVFSHLEKILYPQKNITKKEIIKYYSLISPFMLPLVKDHLIVLNRFPDGIENIGFYQKQIPDYFPKWIKRKTVLLKNGQKQTLVLLNKKEDLLYLANQDTLVFHSWLSSIKKINNPDKIVFDFDPEGNDLLKMRFAILQMKKLLIKNKLVPFLMTTGSRGYHVVVPIKPTKSFEMVHEFAKNIALKLANKFPKTLTVEMSKEKRNGKIFIDYLRNSYGQTSVSCYSLRANANASIATPISWKELSKVDPQKYNIKNIFKRMAKVKDPWKDFKSSAVQLKDI